MMLVKMSYVRFIVNKKIEKKYVMMILILSV
jgi:hypothetical protein